MVQSRRAFPFARTAGPAGAARGGVPARVAVRALPYPTVFTAAGVFPDGPDAYYHLRRIAYSVVGFPRFLDFDPYVSFPDGGRPIWTPLFDFSLAALAHFGLGARAGRALETYLMWAPPLLGAACVLAVHALGAPRVGRDGWRRSRRSRWRCSPPISSIRSSASSIITWPSRSPGRSCWRRACRCCAGSAAARAASSRARSRSAPRRRSRCCCGPAVCSRWRRSTRRSSPVASRARAASRRWRSRAAARSRRPPPACW